MKLQRFALTYFGFMLGLVAISVLLKLFFETDFANGGMALIPAIGAAMIEGQKYVQANDALPDKIQMWRFARVAAAVALAISLVAVAMGSYVVPQIRGLMTQPGGAGILMALSLLHAGFTFLVVRFFLGLAARSQFRTVNRNKQR